MTPFKLFILPATAIAAVHIGVNLALDDDVWKSDAVYLFEPLLLAASGIVVYASTIVHRKNHTKTALYYSFMSVAKLLVVATTLLIYSTVVEIEHKIAVTAHFIVPAILYILLEIRAMKAMLKQK